VSDQKPPSRVWSDEQPDSALGGGPFLDLGPCLLAARAVEHEQFWETGHVSDRLDEHSAGPANETGAVCREERPVVSPLQRAWWRAGGGVRQRNAPLPMVGNCDRSIVANALCPHTLDHHGARPSTSARLPCATLRKSSPPRVVMARPVGDRSPSFFSHMASRNILI